MSMLLVGDVNVVGDNYGSSSSNDGDGGGIDGGIDNDNRAVNDDSCNRDYC